MQPAHFTIDLSAAEYLSVLKRFHDVLQPSTYLEIGTRHGDSLRLAKCASIAIDPMFEISADILGTKPACHLFQTTSDRFFKEQDVTRLFGRRLDFAYLDGMHLAEFLLRDFINVEKWSNRNSLVIAHDCMPSDVFMACRFEGDHESRTRSGVPGWWTGDVWKAIWAIRKYRPDISITGIDSPPTGLLCMTNLDPASTVLEENYFDIVKEMNEMGEDDAPLQQFLSDLRPIKPAHISSFEDISRHFFF